MALHSPFKKSKNMVPEPRVEALAGEDLLILVLEHFQVSDTKKPLKRVASSYMVPAPRVEALVGGDLLIVIAEYREFQIQKKPLKIVAL